jgi:hypothetical protein
MPTPIPDRFHLEMRLGRDDDVDEWLATDVSLDRPVLVRTLGPESPESRRKQFVELVGAVAKVSHPNLTRVYAVGEVPGGSYAILEWSGGSTIADHVNAGRGVELGEFLPNAAGLAGALAALHEAGIAHGALDASAVAYSLAHPAKLGAFGRIPQTDREGDVIALARTLEMALTAAHPGGPPPSERIDGLSPVIDRVLRDAQAGRHDASSIEKALLAAPTPREPAPRPGAGSRRLLYAALILVVLAAALIAVGYVLSEPTQPVLPVQTIDHARNL